MDSKGDTATSQLMTSLYRAMQVLDSFLTDDELTLNKIVEKTGLPKTTAFRAIKTFVALDYLSYDPMSRTYTLSPKLFRLGSVAIHSRPLVRWARPLMEGIRMEFGETVHLNIRSGDERMCIESLSSTHALQVEMPVGHRSPLYAGATAKVLLAGMKDDEINQYFSRFSPQRLTELTVVDPDRLWMEIREIRRRGYAQSYGERIKGVMSISVPVHDGYNEVIAALSVLIPLARAEDVPEDNIRESLLRAAEELSEKLGAVRKSEESKDTKYRDEDGSEGVIMI